MRWVVLLFVLMICWMGFSRPCPALNISKKSTLENLIRWQEDLEKNDPNNLEYLHRRIFVDRLIFKVERKAPESFSETWVHSLIESEIDLERQQAGSGVADFLEQLQQALLEVRERNEDPFLFIRSYTEFSGILTANNFEVFAAAHSYINGKNSQIAHTLDMAQASDYLEELDLESLTPEEKIFKDENLSTWYLQTPSFEIVPAHDPSQIVLLPQMEWPDLNEQSH